MLADGGGVHVSSLFGENGRAAAVANGPTVVVFTASLASGAIGRGPIGVADAQEKNFFTLWSGLQQTLLGAVF